MVLFNQNHQEKFGFTKTDGITSEFKPTLMWIDLFGRALHYLSTSETDLVVDILIILTMKELAVISLVNFFSPSLFLKLAF